ncbi:hypothetical protein [Lacibacter sp. H407]|uniref:hypothetical protein n=1 Tax=Lacibacter sp. H407 TaxID=3133423 RepID=UPI0030BF451C
MAFKIFYSWQSKTQVKYNKYFIEECLKEAIKQLKREMKDDSPDFYIDRDTKDVPGLPNIPTTIEEKLLFCDIFVGDISYVAYIDTDEENAKRTLKEKLLGKNKWVQEGVYSTNVAEELGIAKGAVKGSERVVTIMNTFYGSPNQLNFDIKQSRFPIEYEYSDSTSNEQRLLERKKLVTGLKERIKLILQTELERQKPQFEPFYNWIIWEKVLKRDFPFEITDYIKDVFSQIRTLNIAKTVYRICGLSGIGKTRLLFECFKHNGENIPEEITNKILYVDLKEDDDKNILKAVKKLVQNNENRILIIDNCPKQLHSDLVPIITNVNSKLSLITVSINPDERVEEVDTDGITKMLIIDNQQCKETVTKILANNFSELDDAEKDLLVDFSSGISFFATLMANNPNRGKSQPGSLGRRDMVERILGELILDNDSKAVIYTCCLFSKIGFNDELSYQADNLAEFEDLCAFKVQATDPAESSELKRNKFREICKILIEKQLLERKGRTYAFRPSPLAIRMAEEWWKQCTLTKFQRIIGFLKANNLVESFCEQFQYLRHVENAQIIVKDLCDGVFSSAEVLNSNVGSRLFRSFVYVNPTACSKALVKAFLNLSKLQIEELREGRRNLVWALEKLCFREETFDEAVKVMAAFSVGENENIGNNATNQFLQLFHIFLPGTTTNLERRWRIVEYCLAKDENYVMLGIRILNSSLAVGNFQRMGGAEDQGDPIPLVDYNPSGTEIFEYWKKAIDKLSEFAFNKGQYSEKAIDILLENFYGLSSQGAGQIIVPVIERIINEDLIDKMEARKKVQFVLNSKRIFDTSILAELQRIFESLTPISFFEKFSIYVQSPSSDEYFPEDSEGGHESLLKKIDNVANDFYKEKEYWNELSDNLVAGNIYEGFNFGKALSKIISSDSEKLDLLKLLISKLLDIPKESRNISVIIGLLSGVDDKQIHVEIFNEFLSSTQIRDLSFAIARSIELPFEEINKLLIQTKEGIFPTSQFSSFEYGWGIKHLDFPKVVLIIDTLRSIDNMGKAVSFFTLMKWSHANPDIWDIYKLKIRELVLEDSKDIFETMQGTMDYYYWSDPIIKLLDEIDDSEFADFILTLIIDQCKDFEGFYSKENSFYRVLEKIQEKYFDSFWQHVSDLYNNVSEFGLAAFHFKSLLGSRQDAYANSEGLLFKGDKQKFEIVFEWCKGKNLSVVSRIAELLPIYLANGDGSFDWHPYARKFIDQFGESKEVLGYISAKIGTYSWIGSIVPKLERDLMLFKRLVDHPLENVRIWADLHVQDLEKKIKAESDRDADEIWI